LLISSDLYVLRSPEHVYEVFRMMSVCASVSHFSFSYDYSKTI
jgi:hypothetical protein